MINWSTDEKKFKKEYPEEYKIWRMVQLINYGLDGEKLDKDAVKKSWDTIQNKIDDSTRRYLTFLLWGKLPSSIKTKRPFSNLP